MATHTATTPAIERAVARLLGAPSSAADRAVEVIADRGLLGHGILLLSVLAASRWGTDAPGAIARLAESGTPPESWSAYETRVAGQEGEEEAQRALAALRVDPQRAAAVHTPLAAVEALRDGCGVLTVDEVDTDLERDWIARLCARVGALAELPDTPAAADAAVVPCTSDALDILDG